MTDRIIWLIGLALGLILLGALILVSWIDSKPQELVVTKSHKAETMVTVHGSYSVTVRTGYEKKDGKVTAKTAKVVTRLDKEFAEYVNDVPELTEKDKKAMKYLLAQQEAKCLKHALANKSLLGYLKGEKLIWLFKEMSDKQIKNEVKKIFQRSDIWEIRWEVDNTVDPGSIVEPVSVDGKEKK